MRKIAITADSNSGITREIAEREGVFIVPMLFTIDGKEYLEGISLNSQEFFLYQEQGRDIKSAQPTVGSVLELWDSLLKEYDEVVHIPMTKALSGSYDTALALSREYEGRVFVVDNQRISVTQKQSVWDARQLAEEGKSGREIRAILEASALESSIYLTVDTLSYLKKGGRITPAAAAIGDILNIRPVLQIQGGKIDAYSKVRGRKKSKQVLVEAIQKDMRERFGEAEKGKGIKLHAAYAGIPEEAAEWKRQLEEIFPGYIVDMDELSLNICTHVGKGALGIAVTCNL
ncbi:DegV family protein [Lachnospiraceae bacterium ASD3451]|uniref:DegV family protein n=1 Tax=Diplocloster agilis TaxID=2850323 RepID=UPI001D74AD3C|nr:DegV family protein [Diplocloster agilis]